jgi:SHS2 domain-containing protein
MEKRMIKDRVKLEIAGRNLSQLFEETALKLAEILSQDFSRRRIKKKIIRVKAVDINSLLYEWGDQFLKMAEEHNLVVKKVRIIEMTEVDLEAELELSESKSAINIFGSLSSNINIKETKQGFEVGLVFE